MLGIKKTMNHAVSQFTRGTCRCNTFLGHGLQHFHVCANAVILSLLHVTSVYTTHVFVAATFRCNMAPRVWGLFLEAPGNYPAVKLFCFPFQTKVLKGLKLYNKIVS